MSHDTTSNPSAATLRGIVSDVLVMQESKLQQQAIWTNVDVPAAPFAGDKRAMKLLIYQMVADAVAQMPEGGDLSISAFVDSHMIELEVADSTSMERKPMASEGLEDLAGRCGGRMRWIKCAQGGTARVLQIRKQYQRAAA